MNWALVVLAAVTVQRLAELILAGRNTRRLLARGAVEVGARHYPLVVALHAAWLIGLWVLAWRAPVNLAWLAVYGVLQAARAWVIGSLGERWTTRIIILADAPRVRRGPYRFFPHPNYMIVAAEIAVLPLVFGLRGYAELFFILNAAVLWVRIRAEDRALGSVE